MLWLGGTIYHGKGGRYTMGIGVDMPWVGGGYNIGRWSIYLG